MHTIKIYTTDKKVLKWRSLRGKLEVITEVLNKAKNADFRIDIVHTDQVPEVKDGRVTHAFMDKLREDTLADFVVLHMTNDQRKEFGIKPSLRGSRHNDTDTVGEMYVWADEKTTRGKTYSQFIETILHEIRHELMAGMRLADDTHVLHGTDGTLVDQFKQLDMAKYRPLRQVQKTLLQRVLAEIVRRLTPTPAPIPTTLHKRFYKDYRISQGYGVKNSIYELTGRHIGVDWATPVGTPILAPFDGEMTVVGTHGSLGHFGYFEYTFNGKKRVERVLHLQEEPKRGKYKRGSEIAYSGNTGFSKGAHTHIDGWWGEVNIGLINKDNWDKITYNPLV